MSFVGLATAIGAGATALGATAGVASAIGAVGAGAIGGAGLGALSSAITGGDVGKGALFGALGGGVTGGLGSAVGSMGGSAVGAGTGSTTGTAAGAAVPAASAPITTAAPTIATSSTGGIAPGSVINAMGGVPGSVPASSGVGVVGNSVLAPGGLGATYGGSTAAALPSAAGPYAGTLFGQYPLMTVGAGGMFGGYMGGNTETTQATPPYLSDPYALDPNIYPPNFYKFSRKYKPQAPGYMGYLYKNPDATPAFKPAYYAEGGIASLNPNPDMMSSGPAEVDFMGADAYPTSQQKLNFYSTPSQMPTSAQQAMASYEPATNPLTGTPIANFARGGISDLGGYSDGGRMTKGPGDGMSDSIPASIAGKRPARLAQGEFVVPADVVSHLGNGSTDAGAKQLYSMMDRVRKARTGRKAQGKQIKADKMIPA
jgi:hypothetical protein